MGILAYMRSVEVINMKFLPVIFYSILFSINQVSGQDLLVTTYKSNIVYIGVDNEMFFAFRSKSSKNAVLSVSDGQLSLRNGHYIYRNCEGHSKSVKFYAKDRATKKLIDSMQFRVMFLPDPRISFARHNEQPGPDRPMLYSSDSLTKEATFFHAELADYDVKTEILSFKLRIDSSNSSKIFDVDGAEIPDYARKQFFNLSEHDKMIFSNFKVKIGCESFNRNLKAKLVFEIVDGRAVRVD